MATKDNTPGLLSKVAKFVRNPTTDWAELDNPVSEPDTGYSKQALKEMIERKRQNDFIRRREFDQLRKLRSRSAAESRPDQAERPSFFQTSTATNPDDRAMTLKKIDDIEAQMSKQWWKGRQDQAAAGAAPVVEPPPPPPARDPDNSLHADSAQTMGPAFALTQPADSLGLDSVDPQAEFAQTLMSPSRSESPAASDAQDSGRPEFSSSRAFGAELGDGVSDPDLEEAAIRFANGDNTGAEAGLLEAIHRDDPEPGMVKVWIASLFDFYRATGQQNRFDKAAIEFAQRFGLAAPAWFSMPELLGRKAGPTEVLTVPARLSTEPLWVSPAVFDVEAMDNLNLAVANVDVPIFLDWTAVRSIEAGAVDALAGLFAFWCGAPLQIQFSGADRLEQALRACTVSGDRTAGAARWRLRMDALRIMGLQDEFELAALDYCVTFEVSPPTWYDARCEYLHERPADLAGDTDRSGLDEMPQQREQLLTVPMGLDSPMPTPVAELSGEIMGDAADALARLESARRSTQRLVISCATLVRVDFSAAGGILNWVAQRQLEGCTVQFREVHRLVAAFFNVVGIHEHARVVLRSN